MARRCDQQLPMMNVDRATPSLSRSQQANVAAKPEYMQHCHWTSPKGVARICELLAPGGGGLRGIVWSSPSNAGMAACTALSCSSPSNALVAACAASSGHRPPTQGDGLRGIDLFVALQRGGGDLCGIVLVVTLQCCGGGLRGIVLVVALQRSGGGVRGIVLVVALL